MDQSTINSRWAWVGQVDLFLTNIGSKKLMLGFKIEVKITGNRFLEERAVMATFFMHLKGKIDLRSYFGVV